MINAYINLDKKHASFLQVFKDAGIKKLNIKKIQNQNQLDISLTSLSKYGETKKDLSDIESASKTVPELIICDEEDFDQTLDLIKNPRIEVISSASGLVEVNARIESLLGESSSEKIEFKDLVINLKTYEAKAGDRLLDLTFMEY
jgi:DNA-binding response OmpR family regulator